MEWISIDDRLPKNDNKVLVYPASCRIGCYLCHSKKTWIYPFDGGEIPVTHWMPLPEPPK